MNKTLLIIIITIAFPGNGRNEDVDDKKVKQMVEGSKKKLRNMFWGPNLILSFSKIDIIMFCSEIGRQRYGL